MQETDKAINVPTDDILIDYRRLTDMQDLAGRLLGNLVHCPPDDVPRTIEDSLAQLGAFVGADRAYVFEFLPDDLLSNTFEWCAPGIRAEIDTLQNIPRSVIEFWLKPLAAGQPVYVPDVSALPDDRSAEREVLARQAIQSLLVVPMSNAGNLFGFVGFDSVRTRRTFATGEVSLLSSIADLICAALVRQQIAKQMMRADARLRLQEERFRIIADTVSDVLWDHDFEKKTWWISREWPEKLGISVYTTEGDSRTWFQRVHPEDHAKLRSSFYDILRSDSRNWEVEYRVVGDDEEYIDILVKATVFRHPDGKVSRMVGNARNITQERRNQEGYTRARALEAVGHLTGGIAHDFNNLLMIILGNLEILETRPLDEEDAETVAMITQAAESASTLTRHLLTFARQSKLNTSRVDVKTLVSDTMALLRSGLPESITLNQRIPDDVWDVNVDANGLQQAIVNLAMNARDAMPRGGEIVLTCANLDTDGHTGEAATGLPAGRYVVLSLSDTGIGMSPQVLSRAFEPFFTTKDVGRGTGLGLSTVHGFAKQSGGCASISSEEGRGTSVSLQLPAFDAAATLQKDPAPQDEHASAPSRKRILVVEDEPKVRAHVEKTLVRFGYDVATAPDAAAALRMVRSGQEFDLLFTDIMMPGGMNGQELGEAIAEIAPGIKILYTSGYPAAAFEHIGFKEQSELNFIAKPYRSQKIKERIVQLIGN